MPRNRRSRSIGIRGHLGAEYALEKLQREAKRLRAWLEANRKDRLGKRGGVRLSNRTDAQSAKMATGKGVIQGYTGVAAVDEQTQIIVAAQAHGTGSEQELLAPMGVSEILCVSRLMTSLARHEPLCELDGELCLGSMP